MLMPAANFMCGTAQGITLIYYLPLKINNHSTMYTRSAENDELIRTFIDDRTAFTATDAMGKPFSIEYNPMLNIWPVVEQIEKYGYQTIIKGHPPLGHAFTILRCKKWDNFEKIEIVNAIHDQLYEKYYPTKIEAIYAGVVIFINFFNSVK